MSQNPQNKKLKKPKAQKESEAKKKSQKTGKKKKIGKELIEQQNFKIFQKQFGRSQTELQMSFTSSDHGSKSFNYKKNSKDFSWRKLNEAEVDSNPIIFEFNTEFAMK